MARASVAQLLIFGFAALLVKQLFGAAFVSGSGERTSRRSSVVARHAEGQGASGDRVSLKVLTPEGMGVTESVSEVVLPSASGQLGVLANHAPMMTALDVGVLRYKQAGEWKPLVVMAGFASIDNNQLSVLVNDIEKVEDIDADAGKKELEDATASLEKAEGKKDKLDAATAAKKASARLQAAMFGKKK